MRGLLDWQQPDKAWAYLVRTIQKHNCVDAVLGALADPQGPATVTLPGFSLTDAEARPAYDWCVPSVTGTVEDALAVYEEFVERPQCRSVDPAAIARKAFTRRVGRGYIGTSRPSTHWWMPVVQLMLSTHKCFGGSFGAHGDAVGLDLGECIMEVTREGCWSNFRGTHLQALSPAQDVFTEQLRLPQLNTSHPLAGALLWRGLPDAARWAANTVFRFPEVVKIEDLKPRVRAPRRVRSSGVHPSDAAYLTAELIDAIKCDVPLTVYELYQYAVPGAMKARDFVKLVGDPWRCPDRVPRSATRDRLLAQLEFNNRAN